MSNSLLTVDEALDQILGRITPLGLARSSLLEAAGSVLAEAVASPIDWPRFDASAMDGHAVLHHDLTPLLTNQPVTLQVVGFVPAGQHVETPLRAGQAYKIMTGAPLPPGADTVVMREDTDEGEGQVRVRVAPKDGRGANIRRQGENLRQGTLLYPTGVLVDPGLIGLLASFGRSQVAIHRAPRVAILSTGDELAEIDARDLAPSQIINSSSYMLAAQVSRAGGVPIVLPLVPDVRESITAALKDAIACADLVLTIGGVSMGDLDLVRAAIEELSDQVGFWQVAIKPGKPLAFGSVGGIPLIGLPGNPVSSFVTFEIFVRPALQKLLGSHQLRLPRVMARSTKALEAPRNRTLYVRGKVFADAEGLVFDADLSQSSANLLSVVDIDGLGVVGPGQQLNAGDWVHVDLLRSPRVR